MTERGRESFEPITFEAAVVVFKLIAAKKGMDAAQEAIDAVELATGRKYDRRTIQPLQQLTAHLMLRESKLTTMAEAQLLIDGTPRSEWEDSVNAAIPEVGYQVSASWVRNKALWFYLWRDEDRDGLEQLGILLNRIWIPTEKQIPDDLVNGDGSFHARDISGGRFRWKEHSASDEELARSDRGFRIDRVWFDDADDELIRAELEARLPERLSIEYISRYQTLQKEVSDYVTKAWMNKWELVHGSPSETTIEVELVRQQVLAGGLGSDAKKPEVKLALHLLSEQTRLQDVAIGFVDSVARVLKINTRR